MRMNKPPRARVAAELTVPTREGLSIELNTILLPVDLSGERPVAAWYVMHLLGAQLPLPLYGLLALVVLGTDEHFAVRYD